MNFLELCESAALFARLEADLRDLLAEARAEGDADVAARLADEVEVIQIERRFAVLRALDYPRSETGV